LIFNNRDIFIVEKVGKGWYCEHISKSPTITEFETTLSDTDIMDIFGD